jgi:antitoxin PrlF
MAKGIRYAGTVTTSGNSEAIRLEKALFRAHPEFSKGHGVTASVIAPGQLLVSVADVEGAAPPIEDDPILDAFLAFLASDLEAHPERIVPLSSGAIARAVELTGSITVDDDEVFPDDLSI